MTTNGRSHGTSPEEMLRLSIEELNRGRCSQRPEAAMVTVEPGQSVLSSGPAPTQGDSEERATTASMSVDEEPGEVLSPSQVNCYLECAARWYYRYLVGLPEPLNASLGLGRAVDNAVSHYYRAKGAERKEPPAADVLDAYDVAWAGVEAELVLGDGEDRDQLHAQGRELVKCYLSQLAPVTQPAIIDGQPAVQVPVEGEIAGVKVQGYIDLITEDGTVVDLKTKKTKPNGIPADHWLQLTTYDLLCPHSRGKGSIHTIVKNKTPKCQSVTRDIGPSDFYFLESIYPCTQEAIRSGLYLPRRTSRLCSRKYCPHWRHCEKEFGGRVGE